jgi:uncharacterized ferritin-like protein (DUF455 family)
MTIEEKMAYIQKAIEMGADIDVDFHRIVGKKQAEKIASEFSQMLSVPYDSKYANGTYWFKLLNSSKGVDIAVFYELSREESEAEFRKQLEALEKEEETTV